VNLVRVFNADGTRLYATLQTVPAERTNPSGNTIVTLAEQSDEKPAALLKWFYPGRTTGHEFIYPKQEKQQLAQSRQETIVLKGAAQTVD
jgi:hypothetical protein